VIEYRRLSTLELDKFLQFMDGPAFESQPQWRGCYCQFYLNTQEENDAPDAREAVNRQRACDRIESGVMQGYLAFSVVDREEKVIGWMAANKFNNFVALPAQEEDVAAIICFVVDKQWQGMKVATNLLNFALADLPKHGFSKVQSAPLQDSEFKEWGYRGPKPMFEKAGFSEVAMIDDKHVLMSREL
jgi:N-acetylglutamate synthase-like GNAT family acetyltransferase